TRALNGADVHEGIGSALVGLNEAEAFGGVEPLHGSRRHEGTPFRHRRFAVSSATLADGQPGTPSSLVPADVEKGAAYPGWFQVRPFVRARFGMIRRREKPRPGRNQGGVFPGDIVTGARHPKGRAVTGSEKLQIGSCQLTAA